MQIYLDYSATTPPLPEVIKMAQTVMAEQWGNPSSLHAWGERAAMILETARLQVAQLINASPEALVFTSGGTEANHLALLGIARQYAMPQHLIISSVEHSAIAQPIQQLEHLGWEVTCLPVNPCGRVNPLDLKMALRSNTVLVSIIYGQSEVGTLQPITELGHIARAHGTLFHTDAVQVAGRLPIEVQRLPIDLLSLSSHKLYGPQGAGALYLNPGTHLLPLLSGGGQEAGLRSGTQPLPAIAGFGVAAAQALTQMDKELSRLIVLRDRLFEQLADCPYLKPTGDRLYRLPHHVSFTITATDAALEPHLPTGREVVRQMNLAGIGISAGAACHSGKLSPSPILQAMGYRDEEAQRGIRLTFGRDTTLADIDWTAMALQQVLERAIVPLVLCP